MMAGVGRFVLMLLLGLTLVAASLQSADARSRRGAIGIGIAAGILGAIILNEAAQNERAERQPNYRSDEPSRSRRPYKRD